MALAQNPAAGGSSSLRIPTQAPVTGDIQLIAGVNTTITQDTVNGTFTFTSGGATPGSVIPADISTSHADIFTFPNIVISDSGASANSGFEMLGATRNSIMYVDKTDSDSWKIDVNGINMLSASPSSGVLNLTTYQLNSNRQLSTSAVISAGSNVPDTSAILAATSITKGFLPPRMNTTQRDAIATPAEGLQIHNTTTHVPNFWNGSAWTSSSGSSAIVVSHITSDTAVVFAGLYWLDNPVTAITITLPSAALVSGQTFSFNNAQSGATNLLASVSGQLIDGVDATATPIPIGVQSYVSDGSNWIGISVA